jgi:P4 family phage/plasmid primase-like protien
MTTGVFELLFAPGEVAEIRAVGCRRSHKAWDGFATGNGIVAGYFDNPDAFARKASAVDDAGPKGVYFTLNPVNPALLARGANRLHALGMKDPVTADKDIVCLRWLYVDLDPARPAGISSSREELNAALAVAKQVVDYMEGGLGWSKALRAMSGNGYHLLFRLPDIEPSDTNKSLLRKCLQALDAKFSTDAVKVDLTTFNPARICKLYGTWARKGDSIEIRPHRQSMLTQNNPERLEQVPVTDISKVEALAAMAPEEGAPKGAPGSMGKPEIAGSAGSPAAEKQKAPAKKPNAANSLGTLDLGAYLAHYGVEVHSAESKGGGLQYKLVRCVFNEAHGPNEASIYQTEGYPYLTYQCFHDSCQGKTWKDARAAISGKDKIARFYSNYDPNWKAPPADNPLRDHAVPAPECTLPGPAGIGAGAEVEVGDPPVVAPPAEMDHRYFFDVGDRGRAVFIPQYMANYFDQLYGPIVHTNGQFWRYEGGVWRAFPKSVLFSAGTVALHARANPSWVDNAIRVLEGCVNRVEEEWPDCSNYVNCKSGMIDLGRLVAGDIEDALVSHDPDFGSRVQVPCNFDPDPEIMDDWMRFWFDVFPDDRKNGLQKQYVVQDYFGYCLLPDCRFAKALFLCGSGANGKSTAMSVLEAMVGRENVSTLSITDLAQRFKSQFLENKMVNIATETNTRDPVSTEIFKAAVAGDPITAERKYGEPYVFRPRAKFLLAMNDTPVVPDKSFGFERRLIVIEFTRRFEEHEMDPDLARKLIDKIDGVFFWSLLGLQRLLQNAGFAISEAVAADKKRFLHALYPLLSYFDERLCQDPEMAVHAPSLYKDYKEWCSDGGNRAFSRNKFYEQLLSNMPSVRKDMTYGERRLPHFIGIGLRAGDAPALRSE